MKHLKRFGNLNEDNSQFKISNFYIPQGERSSVTIDDIIGKIVKHIAYDSETLTLVCTDRENEEIYYHFYHEEDCCESVWLDDIVGDLSDLLDYPILKAEEKTNSDDDSKPKNGSLDDSFTWTFYTLETYNGYVDLRFIGTSNGYYSEKIGRAHV